MSTQLSYPTVGSTVDPAVGLTVDPIVKPCKCTLTLTTRCLMMRNEDMTKFKSVTDWKNTFTVCSGISGWWASSFADEAIHNRTVNLRGGMGHNIAMDRVCEFLNAEFKGMDV